MFNCPGCDSACREGDCDKDTGFCPRCEDGLWGENCQQS